MPNKTFLQDLHKSAEIFGFGIIVAILVYLVFSPSPSGVPSAEQIVSQKKNWQYVIAEKPDPASEWKTTTDFISIPEESSGSIWFKKQIHMQDHWQQPVFTVSGYYGNLEVFQDGKLLAADNADFVSGLSRELFHGYTVFRLEPANGSSNLRLRFVHPQGIYLPPLEIVSGNYPDILIFHFQRNLPVLIVGMFGILTGIFTLAVFFYHGIYKYNLESGLGTFLLFVGLFMLGNSKLNLYLYNNYIFWALLGNFSYLLFPFGMIYIFLDIFGPGPWKVISHLKNIHRLYFYLGIIILLLQLNSPINANEVAAVVAKYTSRFFSITYSILIVGGLLVMALISAGKAMKKEKNGLIFTIGVLPTVFLAYHDIYLSRFSEIPEIYSHWGILIYLFAIMVIVGNSQREKEMQMERYSKELAKLENLLKESEIKSLQDRMDPHFLFNSLNTIYSLTKSDSEQTGEAILSLAENYRFLLEKSNDALIDFEDEWLFAVNYLRLFQYRYADILQIEIVREGNFDGVKIPPFTIQPLLENIFKHGFKTIQGNWKIKLQVKIVNRQMQIQIMDNGVGFTAETEVMLRSIGNIRSRMLHYFPDLDFEIENLQPNGTAISIKFTQGKNEI